MGQRSAIIMFLFGGGIVVPVVVLTIIAGSLGRSALPVAVLVQFVGFACLVTAKWPELAAGHIFVRPNPSLNTDVPHAWAAPTGGPPVSLLR